jgi:hypothetical protein
MNVERIQPNQRDQDLAEADAMVESKSRYVPVLDDPPPPDDDQLS